MEPQKNKTKQLNRVLAAAREAYCYECILIIK